MRHTRIALIAVTLLTTGCASDPLAPEPGAATTRGDAGEADAGRWIVVLEPGGRPVGTVAHALLSASGGAIGRAFTSSIRGFTATLSDVQVARLRAQPGIAYIERDTRVRVSGTGWNLERIGHSSMAQRFAGSATGAGVNVYVIDTGIRTTHHELDGRAFAAFDATGAGDDGDCNGHGTHVAGIIGGDTYGVAPQATLHAVRVLDCGGTGSVSDVIAGIDWVAAHHVKPAVANLSITGGASRAVDEAIARAIAAGVVFVVAAGNDARDACGYSPARVSSAITVGATTQIDAVWALSNQGACVDLFAPGASIVSAGHAADGASATMSGTSMAAPHVAGAAALALERAPRASAAAVEAALVADATPGRLTRLGTDSPDLLLQLRATASWQELRERVR